MVCNRTGKLNELEAMKHATPAEIMTIERDLRLG